MWLRFSAHPVVLFHYLLIYLGDHVIASRHSFVIVVFVYLTHGEKAVIVGYQFLSSIVFLNPVVSIRYHAVLAFQTCRRVF